MFFGLINKKSNKSNGNGNAAAAEAQQAGPVPVAADKYRSVYKSWVPGLKGMSASLDRIAKDVEDEFLVVGNNIEEFSGTCNRITALAGNIGNMLESGSGFKSESFNEVFERSYNEIGMCTDLISGKVDSMGEIVPKINSIFKLKLFLEGLSKSITIIGTLIRIETSRVLEAGFEAMTVAVDDLAHQIAVNTEELSLSAGNVQAGIETINTRVAANTAGVRKELELTKGRMNEILEDMANMTSQAKFACKRMEGRSNQITEEIGEIIVALQSHDICRQQMQHVSETLTDIMAKINAMDSMQDSEIADVCHWMTEAVGIQVLQLEHVISEAKTAAHGISIHLERVSGLSGAQQEDADMILEDEEVGSSRITKITSELESLSQMMRDGKSMMTATVSEIANINLTVSGMSGQVANIELISDNINLLALNGNLKVSRAGDSGKGLGVLADEIRKLSSRANEEISRGSTAINGILDHSRNLAETLSEEMKHQLASVEDVFLQTDNAVKKLLTADATMIKSMGEITGITKELEKEIRQVIESIKFDTIIDTQAGNIVAGLRKMLDDIKTALPEGLPPSTMNLEELMDRYTIQSERDIHESRSTSNVKTEAASNVEFF